MITILCVYNKRDVLESMLLASLARQTAAHELLLADNTDNSYSSATEALNELSRRATGAHIVVAHQDIEFDDPRFLEKLEESLDSLGEYGVAGLAGIGPNTGGLRSNVAHGQERKNAGYPLDTTIEVETVDEVLFGVRPQILSSEPFDSSICDNWHLYSVEYCLRMISRGFKNYAIPLTAYHLSSGAINGGYFRSLKKLLRAYRRKFRLVYTTIGTWSTFIPEVTVAQWLMMRWMRSTGVFSALSKIKRAVLCR